MIGGSKQGHSKARPCFGPKAERTAKHFSKLEKTLMAAVAGVLSVTPALFKYNSEFSNCQ